MKVLFLDDDLQRQAYFRDQLKGLRLDLRMVATSAEAIEALERERFDVVCLDHDLDGKIFVESGPGTGYEVAQRLVRTTNRDSQIIVHSLNEEGAKKMLEVLGPSAAWVPFIHIRTVTNAIRLGTR